MRVSIRPWAISGSSVWVTGTSFQGSAWMRANSVGWSDFTIIR